MSLFNPNPKLPEKPKKEVQPHPWEKTIKHPYTRTYKYGHNSANNPIYPPKKEDPSKGRLRFTVIGNRVTKEFIFCYTLVKLMHKYRRKQFDEPLIRGVTSIEWPQVWNDLKLDFGGYAFCIEGQAAVLVNDKFLGGQKELMKFVGSKYIYHLVIDYYREGIKMFAEYIKSSGRPCAYMQISIDDVEIGTMIFMLYSDVVPHTCENFLRLCDAEKGGYAGSPVHRIVKDCWIQCGGFNLKNNPELDCENFIITHDRRGVLCMANDGRHVDCSTQFFVLLQPAPWMAHKYVAFGQLIEGENTLRKIENVPTWYESPTADIKIFKCGLFNMDCHYIPINKNTHEYIQGHIENLFEIGEIFYEELLQRVFLESEFKTIEQMKPQGEEEIEVEDIEVGAEGIHATKRFIRKKSETPKDIQVDEEQSEKEVSVKEKHGKGKAKKGEKEKDIKESKIAPSYHEPSTSIGGDTENKEFDVDEYKYEFEDYTYTKVTPLTSVIIKPEKPYYIPLTDVPYPGEVASEYNLKKMLKGDFCHETDLEMDPKKRKTEKEERRLSVPETLICALFECFETDSFSDSSLDSDEEQDIKNYLKEYGDAASFAGPILKRVANLPKKYAIFDAKHKTTSKGPLSDDELRIIRMAEREIRETRKKKVSISLSASKLSHMKIQRRPTGYVRLADLASIQGASSINFEALEEEMGSSDEDVKHVRIVGPSPSEAGRATIRASQAPRPSVLARLYVDVRLSDAEMGPTLKDYKPATEHSKSFQFITKSETYAFRDDSQERRLDRYNVNEPQSIAEALTLQYGNKISRKISYDYVGTIHRMEHKQGVSVRSLEFAKKRPSMSVMQYKKQNQLYMEQLGEQDSKEMLLPRRRGLRLPGDSPLYLTSKDDLKKRQSCVGYSKMGRVPW